MDRKELNRLTIELTKNLLDKGLVIEAGYVGFHLACYGNRLLPDVQEDEVRNAFFAGAAHLFHSILSGMEDGEQETDNDLRRMDNAHKELERFEQQFKIKHGLT